MKPDEHNSSQSGLSLSQQGAISDTRENKSQEAAANIIRSQIDNLYASQQNSDSEIPEVPLENINPYQRTHTNTESITTQTNDWKKYHTAWQEYYQKYYEGYYTHHFKKAQQQLTKEQDNIKNGGYFANSNNRKPDETITTEEAIFDMRQDIIGKVQDSASKIRKSRHFVPILSGIIVVLIFVFLQYNRVIVSNVLAYVSPGSIDPQNIVIDPNANLAVGPDPLLIIPKINVNVPVYYDIGSDYASQMAAMTKGVAHFAVPGANSHPGEIGNTVIAGHSSNDLLDQGDYKFIFAQLEKLEVGDTIYLNYKSIRYTYVVTKKEVVKPDDVSKLVYPTTKPVLTLLTCVPLGTALNRLLVTSEQISPDPTTSVAATTTTGTSATTSKSIPGSSPTFLERLFSWNWN